LKQLTISGQTTSTSFSSRWIYQSRVITGYQSGVITGSSTSSSSSSPTVTTTTTIFPLRLTGDSCQLKCAFGYAPIPQTPKTGVTNTTSTLTLKCFNRPTLTAVDSIPSTYNGNKYFRSPSNNRIFKRGTLRLALDTSSSNNIGLIPEQAYTLGLRWGYNLKSPNSISTPPAPFPGPMTIYKGGDSTVQFPCRPTSKCKVCEGRCQTNDDCEAGLLCLARNQQGGSYVPGCTMTWQFSPANGGNTGAGISICVKEDYIRRTDGADTGSLNIVPLPRTCSPTNQCGQCEGHCQIAGYGLAWLLWLKEIYTVN